MDADAARAKLLSQHDGIRTGLARCTSLAHSVLVGSSTADELEFALEQLRHEFVAHNATESELVGELLLGLVHRGPLLIDRMLEEHLAEHAEFLEKLAGTASEVASRIVDLVEELEAHMAAEERTFLSPLVLRCEPPSPPSPPPPLRS